MLFTALTLNEFPVGVSQTVEGFLLLGKRMIIIPALNKELAFFVGQALGYSIKNLNQARDKYNYIFFTNSLGEQFRIVCGDFVITLVC